MATSRPTMLAHRSDQHPFAVVDRLSHLRAVQAEKDDVDRHRRSQPVEDLLADLAPRSSGRGRARFGVEERSRHHLHRCRPGQPARLAVSEPVRVVRFVG